MKVLILHQHFNTPGKGGAIRSYYLAKALQESGDVEIRVITGSDSKIYKKELYEGIAVHYLPVPYDNRFGFVARIKAFFSYLTGVVRLSKEFQDIDICYVISTPLTTGLAGIWIKRRYKIPFIFEVGDLWPDAPIQLGYIKNYFLKAALYQMEKLIYREAQSIVALSSVIKSEITKKISDKKVTVVTNFADTDFYRKEFKDEALTKKYNVENKFVISYIGALGVANGLDYYLECARACQKAGLPIQFFLCGDGAMGNNLKDIALRLELKNVSIIPFQNRDGVRELMNVSDAVFVSYKPVRVLETGSPNKYFDGLASGKLIILNFGGWIKEEIENNQCGVSLDPRYPTDVVEKIRPFVCDRELLDQFQKNARALSERKYSREIMGQEFATLIKESVVLL